MPRRSRRAFDASLTAEPVNGFRTLRRAFILGLTSTNTRVVTRLGYLDVHYTG
jgi:hypothetical protein